MKKTMLAVVFICIASFGLHSAPEEKLISERFRIGFRWAFSYPTLSGDNDSDSMSLVMVEMGSGINVPLGQGFVIETGLTAATSVYKKEGSDNAPSVWYSLHAPVIGKYYFYNTPSTGINAQLGFVWNMSQSHAHGSTKHFKNYISFVLGVGFDLGDTTIDIRFEAGLMPYMDSDPDRDDDNLYMTRFVLGFTF